MTKEELEQYRSIVAELDEIRDRLNNYTVSDTVTGSDSEFPYVKHSISVGGVTERRECHRDMILKRRLEVQKQEIDEFLDNMSDSMVRRIIKIKYIEGIVEPTWLEVAKIMYPKLDIGRQYKMKNTLRMALNRYLRKTMKK